MTSDSNDLLALVDEMTTKLKAHPAVVDDPASEELFVQQVSKLHSLALARFGWLQLRRSDEFRERFLRAAAEASETNPQRDETADDSEWLERALAG